MHRADKRLSGEIVDERVVPQRLGSVAHVRVEEPHIVELVEEGVLSVARKSTQPSGGSARSARRARIALRLERDLGINLPGVALALDLLEELERLRREREGAALR